MDDNTYNYNLTLEEKMNKTKAKKVFICSACQEVLKVHHLNFSAVKCTKCDNVITVEQIKKESEVE